MQALVLFTTREVIQGDEDARCSDFDNTAGRTGGTLSWGDRMPELLRRILARELRRAASGRVGVKLYWCEIERVHALVTFERVARAMHAARPPGHVGKEVWINLTGGTNIVNLALQLAAALLGGSSRLYYLLSDDPRCLRHTVPRSDLGTERDRFWVDIPVLRLRLDVAASAILEILEQQEHPIPDDELLSRLKSHAVAGSEFWQIGLTTFRHAYLLPMSGQELLARADEHSVAVGREWPVLRRYYEVVADLRRPDSQAELTLDELASKRSWFYEDEVKV